MTMYRLVLRLTTMPRHSSDPVGPLAGHRWH